MGRNINLLRRRIYTVLVLALVCCLHAGAYEGRYALVIGNATYKGASYKSLSTPLNDAAAMKQVLEELGFKVIMVSDGSRSDITRACAEFRDSLSNGTEVGVFYYSGHSITGLDRQEYMLPAENNYDNVYVVDDEKYCINRIAKFLKDGCKKSFLFIDGCRKVVNEIEGDGDIKGAVSGGINSLRDINQQMKCYATRGDYAYTGSGRLSPFTQALVNHIKDEDLEFARLFQERIKPETIELSGGKQEPEQVETVLGFNFSREDEELTPELQIAKKLYDKVMAYSDEYYYDRANRKSIAEEVMAAAVLGDKDAQFTLGQFYKFEFGVERDRDRASYWYKKSAEQGQPIAQFYIGDYYFSEDSIPNHYQLALEWFTKSAEQGVPLSQYSIGLCYFKGYGVAQDYKKAIEWYTKAAEQGETMSQCSLGNMYAAGWGVPQDYDKAIEWYTKPAEQGDRLAQYYLGKLYAQDKGSFQDYKKAAYWYTKAAEGGYLGHRESQYELGRLYEAGNGVEKDLGKAIEWYTHAAEQGYKPAINRLNELGINTDDFDGGEVYGKRSVLNYEDD